MKVMYIIKEVCLGKIGELKAACIDVINLHLSRVLGLVVYISTALLQLF